MVSVFSFGNKRPLLGEEPQREQLGKVGRPEPGDGVVALRGIESFRAAGGYVENIDTVSKGTPMDVQEEGTHQPGFVPVVMSLNAPRNAGE